MSAAFQGENSHLPPISVLLLLLITALFGALLGGGAGYLLAGLWGKDMMSLLGSAGAEVSHADRNLFRAVALVNHLFTFLLPGLLVSWMAYRKGWFNFLRLGPLRAGNWLFWGPLFILVAFPFAQFTYWLNRLLPLPDFMVEMEANTQALIQGFLVMDSPVELFFNLLVIALVPAVAEEIVFRGVLQQQLERFFGHPLKAVWVGAVIFSFMHFQFEGFLPRMVLGALLGYLFYWSRNLWVPIAAHFVNNGLQVLAAYWYPEEVSRVEELDMTIGLAAFALLSLIGVILIGRYLSGPSNVSNNDPVGTA